MTLAGGRCPVCGRGQAIPCGCSLMSQLAAARGEKYGYKHQTVSEVGKEAVACRDCEVHPLGCCPGHANALAAAEQNAKAGWPSRARTGPTYYICGCCREANPWGCPCLERALRDAGLAPGSVTPDPLGPDSVPSQLPPFAARGYVRQNRPALPVELL